MSVDYKVYVIENTEGRRYIGLSEDVAKRLIQHNRGDSKWTSKFRPWTLLWESVSMTLSDARKLENRLKASKGGNGFYEITGLPRS